SISIRIPAARTLCERLYWLDLRLNGFVVNINFKSSLAPDNNFVKQFLNFQEKSVQRSPMCKVCYGFTQSERIHYAHLSDDVTMLVCSKDNICSQNTLPTMNHMR
ncbi:MAG: hypothetical protein IKZ43_08240, partial [Acidaminococcaceae bacterium]|nr:hypothetical protein [Acidaminococcaceae bacterium]